MFRPWRWKDVSHDDEAIARVRDIPELRTAFEQLGFSRVGFVHEDMTNAVFELLADARGTAFVLFHICRKGGVEHAAELSTVFEDGSVVTTSSAPKRYPSNHHPRAGYYLEKRPGTAPAELWELHQKRIQELADLNATRVPQHRNVALALEGIEREVAVMTTFARVVNIPIILFLGVFVVATGFLGFSLASHLIQFPQGLEWEGMLTIAGGTALGASLATFVWLAVAPWLVRMLPWPRRRPLGEAR